MRNIRRFIVATSMTLGTWAVSGAQAAIVQIPESAFVAGAGQITFSELPLGTVNPVYSPGVYGGGAGSPTVSFGGYFVGQSLGDASSCAAGAALSGCVVGKPTATLALDPRSPETFIATDSSNPDSPVLSGSPLYNGPVSILFSTPQAGVGLIGGYFDNIGSTAITAFDINGNVIGSVKNNQIGLEFLGLVTSDKSASIAGLQFSLVGNESFGFAIDDVRFGAGGSIVVPSVPLPASAPMFGAALLVLSAAGYAAKRKKGAAAA